MTKLTLSNVPNIIDATSATAALNGNNAKITTALENTLSRDGTAPNEMDAPLDMNGQQIYNLPAPLGGQSPLRLQDLSDFNGGGTIASIPAGGTTGQVLGKNSNNSFDIGWKNSVTSVGLALPAGDFTVFGSPVTTSGTLSASYVNTPTGTGAFVKQTSPSLVTPSLDVATATSINKVSITAPATSSTLTIANGKTLTANNSIGLSGVDGKTLTVNNSVGFTGVDSTVYALPTVGTSLLSPTSTNVLSNKTIDGTTNVVTRVSPWNGGYIAGRYYLSTSGGGQATQAIGANSVYFFPMMVGETHTFDRIAFEVTTAGTAANARMAIYTASGGKPATLVVDSGSSAISGTGMKAFTIAQTLTPGAYYLALVLDGTSTVASLGNTQLGSLAASGFSGITASDTLMTATLTFGAFPATAFAGGMGAITYNSSSLPIMALRA